MQTSSISRLTPMLFLLCPLLVEATSLQSWAEAYVDEAGRAPAVAIARITPEGVERGIAGPESVGKDSLFQVGSITKVFTGILLAELVADEIVTLDARIGDILGQDRYIDPDVASITLQELATHTSGLPRLPMNARMMLRLWAQQSDPYHGLTTNDLFDDLASVRGDRLDKRGQMHYSNFGMAVLGRVLERAAGDSYENLVRSRVLVPLGLEGMDFTGKLIDDPAMVTGHRGNLRPTRHWHFSAYAPAGGMVASLAHMERFLVSAMQAEPDSSLAASISAGLGWLRTEHEEGEMIWHNGQTGGFHAFLGFDPVAGRGVVVLSNAANSADDFAVGLLRDDPRPGHPDPGWLMLGFTLLFTPAGVLLVLGFLNDPESRLHGIDAFSASAFLLGATWKLGAWTSIPLLYWYLSALVILVLAVLSMPRFAAAPWAPVDQPWTTGAKALSAVLFLVLTAWVLLHL